MWNDAIKTRMIQRNLKWLNSAQRNDSTSCGMIQLNVKWSVTLASALERWCVDRFGTSKHDSSANVTAAAGVRSLHNCLRLDRVIRGVKREQGTGTRPRLPITAAILRRLQHLLNPLNYSDSLFWAACCTGFFGFLRCGEFTTTSSSYDPNTHLSLADVKVDSTINPTCSGAVTNKVLKNRPNS